MPNIHQNASFSFSHLRSLFWVAIMVTLPIGCTYSPEQKKVAAMQSAIPASLLPLMEADKVTLYSIDGNDYSAGRAPRTDEFFGGYPVLGKCEIKDTETRRKLVGALATSIDKGMEAKCFWPRHALRAEKGQTVVDFVICFECDKMEIRANGKITTVLVENTPVKEFNQHLRNERISLAPMNGDKEIGKKDEKDGK